MRGQLGDGGGGMSEWKLTVEGTEEEGAGVLGKLMLNRNGYPHA